MKWSDESIVQLIEQYEKNKFLYNASLKTYHDRILNKSVNCIIDKLAVFFLPVSFAGSVSWFLAPDDWRLFLVPETDAGNRCRKYVPNNGQCVINFSHTRWMSQCEKIQGKHKVKIVSWLAVDLTS